jgi:hypothetical protein
LLRRTLHRPDPLLLHITERLLDRLEDCLSKFPTAVILGGAGEVVAQGLAGGRAGVEKVIHMDTSPAMLELAKVAFDNLVCVFGAALGKHGMVRDCLRKEY